MPAAEQTWRSQKRLHLVFGISSVLLLLATLWMFQADHQREWKQVQRVARNIDIQTTRWRKEAIEFEIARQTENKLQQELHSSKRKKFAEDQLEHFESIASGPEEISESARASFTQAVAAHGQATAEAVPEAREGVLAAIDEVIKEVPSMKTNCSPSERQRGRTWMRPRQTMAWPSVMDEVGSGWRS